MTEIEKAIFDALANLIGRDGSKQLHPKDLISRLANLTGLVQTDVRIGLAGLAKKKMVTGINIQGDALKKVGWVDTSFHPIEPHQQILNEVLEANSEKFTSSERIAVARLSLLFNGLTKRDVEKILLSVLSLRDRELSQYSTDRFILSAQHIMSSSKIADRLSKLLLVLGIALPPDKATYYALTAGSPFSQQVLFIENPRVFSFVASFAEQFNTLVVACYGYGLALANFGDLLNREQIIACATDHFPRTNLSEIISAQPCLYWGDLDYEGIHIYEKLAAAIPKLELSGSYEIMLNIMCSGEGHPYHKLFGKDGQAPATSKTVAGQKFMELCKNYSVGVDQESICVERNLAKIFTRYAMYN